MFVFYLILFLVLIVFSAFFSSAETSLLSINKIKLNLKADKKNKKALLLKKILKNPEEFFSTILIGNNFVNIAAASISTVIVTRLIEFGEEFNLLVSTLATTIIILFFAEIVPKSYAFRHSENLSYLYAYPIQFFNYLLYPFVKSATFISNLFFLGKVTFKEKKELTTEEIKHFLSSEAKLFRYSPESLRMVNEIIDIAEKDIKSIMTPRMNIIALEESSDIDKLMKLVREKKVSKIPIYCDNLDNITGIIHTNKLIPSLVGNELDNLNLKDIAETPIFISEYSSLNYALKEFKKKSHNLAIILDEYGATIGILALNDVFREILGEIKIGHTPIRQTAENQFVVKGNIPVEEVNSSLKIQLPEKKDYTTLSGLFVYFYGKFPKENSRLKIKNSSLIVKKMGTRKIDEIILLRAVPKEKE